MKKNLLESEDEAFTEKDPNAKGNGYMIRSLYFEDYFNSAYAEKESGVLMRKKYRIRIYDCSDRSIKLERKKKFGSYIYKESAPLTKEEFYKIPRWGLSIFIKKSISVVQRILCGMCQQSHASTYDR